MSGPRLVTAAAQADLRVELWHHSTGSQDVRLAVTNYGDDASPATTLHVETLAPGSDTPTGAVTIAVPALTPGSNRLFETDYHLAAACATGMRVRASVEYVGDPTPSDNTLVAFPCQPDLGVSYKNQRSDRVLEFVVANLGGEDAPAAQVHFQTLTTPPSNVQDVPIGALGAGQSDVADYTLDAACAGLKVRAEVPFAAVARGPEGGAPARGATSVLELFPCGPDLHLSDPTYLDANHDLAYVVTNVGGTAAPATTARVERVAPSSTASALREFAVPTLQPGQSFGFNYGLGSGLCPSGLQVHASVPLDIDASPDDNSKITVVCGENGEVAPHLSRSQVLTRPDLTGHEQEVVGAPSSGQADRAQTDRPDVVIPAASAAGQGDRLDADKYPERLPGTHTLEFPAAVVGERKQYATFSNDEFSACFSSPDNDAPGPGFSHVGWYQYDGCEWAVWQTAVRFDLSQLDPIASKTITDATLTFDERKNVWTDYDGSSRDVPGCVATLGLATTDWVGSEPNGPYPNATIVDFSPWPSPRSDFSGTAFTVTDQVRLMFAPEPDGGPLAPLGRELRNGYRSGFVLRGAIEELHADDSTSCLSWVSNLKLHITYVVPESQ
jgi:hypothetical protein